MEVRQNYKSTYRDAANIVHLNSVKGINIVVIVERKEESDLILNNIIF